MKSFFTRNPNATWARQGLLHVYLLPGDEVAALAAAYQNRLAERGVTDLPPIPQRWLHITVEKINVHADDLPQDSRTALINALRTELATVPTFNAQVGPHLVGQHAVELDVVPDEPWRVLRQAVRKAATAALGDNAVAPVAGPGRPHIALAYATGNVDLEPHLGALNHVRAGRAEMRVEAAELVAVRQEPDLGLYSWDPIERIPLGPPA